MKQLTSKGKLMGATRIRKFADRSDQHTDGEHWPLSHVEFVGENDQPIDPPQTWEVTQRLVLAARDEGWISMEGSRIVYRPSGRTPDDVSNPPHVFVHADIVVVHLGSGDARYRVAHQPDKYADHDGADDTTQVTDQVYLAGDTRVDTFYVLEREN